MGLEVVDIRGNVDTRVGKVRSGAYDAVVLARAGLARIGRLAEATETIDPLQMLPAPGQGALAVECREDRADVRAAVAALDDEDTRVCVTAERALLAALEAGCTAPVGALAEVVEGEDGPELSLRAFVGAPDGSVELRRSVVAPVADPVAAGLRLAALLLEDGAGTLVGRSTGPQGMGGAGLPATTGQADAPPTEPPNRPPEPPGATGTSPVAALDRTTDRVHDRHRTERAQ